MDECLSENQLADLLSGSDSSEHQPLRAHLDHCATCLAAVAAALRASAPSRPSRFTIVRRLGAGGMGTVYEAHDRERDTRVALKMLRPHVELTEVTLTDSVGTLASVASASCTS